MLTISGRTLGTKRPLFEDWSVPLPPELQERGDGGVTLRDIVTRIVLLEIAAFKKRQRKRQVARALSAVAIEEGVTRGKVDSGERELDQKVDEEEAVHAALQAFEDGIYLVILDGMEKRNLDEKVYLQPDSTITFVRLVMLAGG